MIDANDGISVDGDYIDDSDDVFLMMVVVIMMVVLAVTHMLGSDASDQKIDTINELEPMLTFESGLRTLDVTVSMLMLVFCQSSIHWVSYDDYHSL